MLDPDHRLVCLLDLLLAATGVAETAGGPAARELGSLLAEHGIRERPSLDTVVDWKDPKAALAVARPILGSAGDLPGLGRGLLAVVRRHGTGDLAQMGPKPVAGELGDLRIRGDRATGRVGGQVFQFVRVGGRWYLGE